MTIRFIGDDTANARSYQLPSGVKLTTGGYGEEYLDVDDSLVGAELVDTLSAAIADSIDPDTGAVNPAALRPLGQLANLRIPRGRQIPLAVARTVNDVKTAATKLFNHLSQLIRTTRPNTLEPLNWRSGGFSSQSPAITIKPPRKGLGAYYLYMECDTRVARNFGLVQASFAGVQTVLANQSPSYASFGGPIQVPWYPLSFLMTPFDGSGPGGKRATQLVPPTGVGMSPTAEWEFTFVHVGEGVDAPPQELAIGFAMVTSIGQCDVGMLKQMQLDGPSLAVLRQASVLG